MHVCVCCIVYIRARSGVYVCMYGVRTHISIHLRMCVCTYVCTCMRNNEPIIQANPEISMFVWMNYVCMYVYVHMYICELRDKIKSRRVLLVNIYIYIYTYMINVNNNVADALDAVFVSCIDTNYSFKSIQQTYTQDNIYKTHTHKTIYIRHIHTRQYI